jgi:hypothetical protein
MTSKKQIDYLLEDRPIHGQKYALVSIVGPKYKQNCDIYAIKIRGFANDIEEAKRLTQSILKYDPSFDIYTAPVGIFFPIDVDPTKVKNVQYANKQLNDLVQQYHENQIEAQDNFQLRKQEMMESALREGKNQQDAFKKPEHPVSVLGRIQEYKTRIREMTENIESLKIDLSTTESKFEMYSDLERQEANDILTQGIQKSIDTKNTTLDDDNAFGELDTKVSFDTLDYTLQNNVTQIAVQEFEKNQSVNLQPVKEKEEKEKESNTENIQNILLKLDDLKTEITSIESDMETYTQESAKSTNDTLAQRKSRLVSEKERLISLLNKSSETRQFINKSFGSTDNTAFMDSL